MVIVTQTRFLLFLFFKGTAETVYLEVGHRIFLLRPFHFIVGHRVILGGAK
jgi:hypothetical protein